MIIHKHIVALSRALGALLLVCALLAGTHVPAFAAPNPPQAAADHALEWVRTQQQADGSFPGFGAGSTADVVFAIASRGQNANTYITKNGVSPVDYLMGKAADLAKTPGGAAKAALAASVAGKDPHAFGGVDLIAAINSGLDPSSGHYGKDVTGQALVILALKARKDLSLDPRAYDWLVGAQSAEGGWSYDGTGAADTNTTGIALQALATAPTGNYKAATDKALTYLHTQQNDDAGFPYSKSDPTTSSSDANSTAAVVSGLNALYAGADSSAWAKNGRTALESLMHFQNASGALRYQADVPDDNAGATYQAIPALESWKFPIGMAPGQGINTSPAPGMPITGTPLPTPLWPLALALVVLAGGATLRRRAVR